VYACAVVSSHKRLCLRINAVLVLASIVVGAVAGLAGAAEVALFAAPFLLIAGLLLSGRYVGEDRILAARRTPPPARRGRAQRWPTRRELPFSSALERAPRSLRGPPAALLTV
jgi:hypothetical protein